MDLHAQHRVPRSLTLPAIMGFPAVNGDLARETTKGMTVPLMIAGSVSDRSGGDYVTAMGKDGGTKNAPP